MRMNIAERSEAWFAELYRLMWAMVWETSNSARFYLNPEDMFAELSAELVYVVRHYNGELDHDDMKAVLITSLRNRCRDLMRMEYGTHRQEEYDVESLDEELPGWEGVTLADKLSRPGVDELYFLPDFLDALSDDAWALVMEVLDPSEKLMDELALTAMRKAFVGSLGYWVISINKRVCQRALGWPDNRIDNAWEEVERALGLAIR